MRTELAEHQVIVPFVEHLGCRLVSWGDGLAELHFEPRPEHTNNFGAVHGGVIMTILDVAMARAGRSLRPQEGLVTVEMKTSFAQAARGALVGQGKLLHMTQSMAFVEAKVLDAQGQLCAFSTGTFKFIRSVGRSGGSGMHQPSASLVPTD